MTLSIVLVQDNPVLGNLEKNSQTMINALDKHSDADLIVFPECFLTGYPLEDLVVRPSFLSAVNSEIDRLKKIVSEKQGPALLFGSPTPGSTLPYNSAILIRNDGSLTITHKTELPNTDVFDEKRVFDYASNPVKPMMLKGYALGVMICEDMWHGNVTRFLSEELADILICLNGSPFEEDKQALRLKHATRRSKDSGLPIIYLNLVGGQDEIVFDGASFVLNKNGHHVTQMKFGEPDESCLIFRKTGEIERQTSKNVIGHSLYNSYPKRLESLYTMCVLGLRDYFKKNGLSKATLGVSGGIDSALVAAMAVDALGSENVRGIMMPSKYTSQDSLDLADDIMTRLKMPKKVISIEAAYDIMAKTLENDSADFSPEQYSLALENIQARLRGMTLMAQSNADGSLVLSTGNKSEMSVGYSTLYGDMCGGFNPLKDIYKTDVWALSHWRNENIPTLSVYKVLNVIPEDIITRAPSAELKPDQTDEANLGSYAVLDELLKGIVENELDALSAKRRAEKILGLSIEDNHAMRIARLVKIAEYKRRQAPIGVKLTKKSFGRGWRYPISNNFKL